MESINSIILTLSFGRKLFLDSIFQLMSIEGGKNQIHPPQL
jgi:hypothetical protein